MAIIKKIATTETYPVRLPVLRKGKPVESCRFDGDDLKTTLHFGLFLDQELVGIVSLFKKKALFFLEKKTVPNSRHGCFGQSQKKRFWQSTHHPMRRRMQKSRCGLDLVQCENGSLRIL